MHKIKFIITQLLLWVSTPFQKFLQQVGHQESQLTDESIDTACALIESGDIILTYESGRPTSVFIPGPLDHAAIVTNVKTVMEAVGDLYKKDVNFGGVREVPLRGFLTKKNQFVVIRPVYSNTRNINKSASSYSHIFKGLNYDYQFRIDNENVYCSELVYLCYRKFDEKFMEHISFYDQILPDEYLKLASNSKRDDLKFEIIFDTRTI